jgi:N6-adenosine-specific RNA methylase IME4
MDLPNKKYNIIYADPPWHYGRKSAMNNSSGKNYKTLKCSLQYNDFKSVKRITHKKITQEDTACFMWVTDSHIDEALESTEVMGFQI